MKNILVAVIAGAVILLVLVMLTPGGRLIRSPEAELWPMIKGLGIAFFFSLMAAGFHEEFFFRGILQTRYTKYFNSEISGIIAATLMFGIYHLPFRFYQGASQGNLEHALAVCFTETIFSAFILGILWSRTKSLIAPVLVHTLIDTISILPMIMTKYNL